MVSTQVKYVQKVDIYIDSFRSKGVYELDRKNGQKLPKFTHLTFKFDLWPLNLTFKMTPGGVENGAIELSVLKIPYMDPRSYL